MTCLIKSDYNFPTFLFGFYLWISRIDPFTNLLVGIYIFSLRIGLNIFLNFHFLVDLYSSLYNHI